MVRVAGVPEHFNVPWRIAVQEGAFAARGLDVAWEEIAEGSGAMLRALESGAVDAALVLTEAVVAAASRGQELAVLGTWICSPLVWGVHVHAASRFRSVEELRDGRFGISRPGSGSHLMAWVEAARRGWNPARLRFETVGAVQTARDAFDEGRIDAYLWEEITTRPWVRLGEWRCIGQVEAPWPAFLLVTTQAGAERVATLREPMFEVLRDIVIGLRADPDQGVLRIAEEAALHPDDVADWFAAVRWAAHGGCDRAALERARAALASAGALGAQPFDPERLCAHAGEWDPGMR